MSSYRICKDDPLDDVNFNCSSWEWQEVPITLSQLGLSEVIEITQATLIIFVVAFGFNFVYRFILNR